MLHLVNYFVEQFFVWNKSWLCTTDKSCCSRWHNSYQAFQCNMMLLAWIKGTFNGEDPTNICLDEAYWRRLQCNIFLSFKTSSRHNCKTSWRRLEEDVYRYVLKTSWRRLWKRSCKHVLKTSWRRLEDVLEDEKLLRWRRLQDVFKTSWKIRNVCWGGSWTGKFYTAIYASHNWVYLFKGVYLYLIRNFEYC